jgi:hypothetical protein
VYLPTLPSAVSERGENQAMPKGWEKPQSRWPVRGSTCRTQSAKLSECSWGSGGGGDDEGQEEDEIDDDGTTITTMATTTETKTTMMMMMTMTAATVVPHRLAEGAGAVEVIDVEPGAIGAQRHVQPVRRVGRPYHLRRKTRG